MCVYSLLTFTVEDAGIQFINDQFKYRPIKGLGLNVNNINTEL